MTLDLLRAHSNPYALKKRLLTAVDDYDKELLASSDSALSYLKSNISMIVAEIIDSVNADKDSLDMIQTTTYEEANDIDTLTNLDTPTLSGLIRTSVLIERLDMLQERLDAIPKFTHTQLPPCDCGGKMTADYDSGCHVCVACGAIQASVVSMFVEDRGTLEISSKPKSNSYKTHKHFDKWMNRILAIDAPKDGNDILPEILRYFRERGIKRDLVDGESIRKALKTLGLNKYYVYTSWLLKEVTGRGPPQLTEDESRDIAYRFGVISDTFDKIRNKAEKKMGRIYYPFFIYKIILTKFANRPDKIKLLHYIHVQEEKTQSKNNAIYAKIIKEANNPRLIQKD